MALDYHLKVNGLDLSDDLGIALLDVGDVFTYAGVNRRVDTVPGLLGALPNSVAPGRMLVRPISVTWETTIEDRREEIAEALALFDGLVELEWGDGGGRIEYGYIDTAPARARFPELAFLRGHVVVDLEVFNPYAAAFDRDVRSMLVDSTDRELDLGQLPSSPWFVFPGWGGQDLTITYKGGDGETKESLVIDADANVTSSQWLEVDCGATGAERISLGDASDSSRTRKQDWWSSGGYPTFDPGDGRLGARPMVSATQTGVVYWRRAYPC